MLFSGQKVSTTVQHIPQHVKDRFAQLAEQSNTITFKEGGNGLKYAAGPVFHTWAASALSLVFGVFGKESPHYAHLDSAINKAKHDGASPSRVDACFGAFLGAKNDVDGDFVFRLEAQFSGEVFGDFIVAAKVALAEGRFQVAAVLACAALEDALKRYAFMNGLDVTGKTMEDVVNALKTKGLVGGAQKALLSAMPKIRNIAMHANWGELTAEQAGSVIGFTEQFLLTNF